MRTLFISIGTTAENVITEMQAALTVLLITVGHGTISCQISRMSEQFFMCAEKMFGRKRPDSVAKDESPPCRKHSFTIKTVDKWITDNYKALNTTDDMAAI